MNKVTHIQLRTEKFPADDELRSRSVKLWPLRRGYPGDQALFSAGIEDNPSIMPTYHRVIYWSDLRPELISEFYLSNNIPQRQ